MRYRVHLTPTLQVEYTKPVGHVYLMAWKKIKFTNSPILKTYFVTIDNSNVQWFSLHQQS